MARVQVILEDEERELFRRQAAVEGLSLSAWMRAAAQESFSRKRRRGGIESVDDLRELFRMCDERAGEEGREPEWVEHLQVIERSKGAGSSPELHPFQRLKTGRKVNTRWGFPSLK